jgi:hypothetical protein
MVSLSFTNGVETGEKPGSQPGKSLWRMWNIPGKAG